MSLLLNGEVDPNPEIIAGLRGQIRQLEEALRQERTKVMQVENGVQKLRQFLGPLYNSLQMIYGEIDDMGLSPAQESAVPPQVSRAWENWKQKLGGIPARFIDALMIHGSMTQTQLRIAVGCAQGSVAGAVCVLNKAGLINKNGGKISLKEL
jgi:hypothetical protein